jgi:hypothetical protein
MPFEYEAEGRVRVNGCAGIAVKENYDMLYGVGDRVWIKKKARMGEAESVVIKRLARRRKRSLTYSGLDWQVVYTDTFNRVWMEYELVSEEDATDLILTYEEKVLADTRRKYDEGACLPIKPRGCS